MEDDQSLYFGKHPHPDWYTPDTDHLGRANVRSIKSYVVVEFLFFCEVDLLIWASSQIDHTHFLVEALYVIFSPTGRTGRIASALGRWCADSITGAIPYTRKP